MRLILGGLMVAALAALACGPPPKSQDQIMAEIKAKVAAMAKGPTTADAKDLAVFTAIEKSDVEGVKSALAAGGKTTAMRNGSTPLHLAVGSDNVEITNVLIAAGADVNAPTGNALKLTPLMSAAMSGTADTAKVLVAAKANVHAKSINDQEAIHFAASMGSNAALVKILLDAGADANVKTKLGFAPLHVTCWVAMTPSEKMAQRERQRKDVPEMAGTPYFKKTEKDFSTPGEIAKVLLDAGAAADTVAQNDSTPLTLAAMKGYGDVIRFLVAKKVDLNARHHAGGEAMAADVGNTGTAVMFAAAAGHLDAVQALAEAGADLNLTTMWRNITSGAVAGTTTIETVTHTALSIASDAGHADVVAYLRTKGAKGPKEL